MAIAFTACDRQYRSHATIEVQRPDAEAAIRAHLPQRDGTVTLKNVRNTDLYEIIVSDATNPQAAANRANELTMNIQKALNDQSNGKPVKVWEKAEPALQPTWK